MELTGPYFHKGGRATLEQVVEFNNFGGDRKDLFEKDPHCGGVLITYDACANQVVAADPDFGLIDNGGFLKGSG